MRDRKIDPTALDFVAGPRGSFVVGDALDNKVLLSLTVDLGSWEGDPLLGNRFAELQRAQDTNETLRRAEGFAREALQWLIDAGELESVEATFTRFARTIYTFEVDYTPPGRQKRSVGPVYVKIGAQS